MEERSQLDEYKEIPYSSSEEVLVPDQLINQVIGQKLAVDIIKMAVRSRRHVLLIGPPGVGKSMIGQAYAQLLPPVEREEVFAFHNFADVNHPDIVFIPQNQGDLLKEAFSDELRRRSRKEQLFWILGELFLTLVIIYSFLSTFNTIILLFGIIVLGTIHFRPNQNKSKFKENVPNQIIPPLENNKASFIDGTGASKGRLLGDVKHDPYQSGGLETLPHERLMPGLIHLAHKGVLFIDEIGSLDFDTQISLLTAMQEKKYPIQGRSEGGSGAIVQSDPLPCDFALIAAGNKETLEMLHPGFRSRIIGYGFIIMMNEEFPDSPENRMAIARFIGQETKRENGLNFDRSAILAIIDIAKLWASQIGMLSLRFRDLGGIVRTAGDIALNEHSLTDQGQKKYVTADHVAKAYKISKTIYIESRLPPHLTNVPLCGLVSFPSGDVHSNGQSVIYCQYSIKDQLEIVVAPNLEGMKQKIYDLIELVNMLEEKKVIGRLSFYIYGNVPLNDSDLQSAITLSFVSSLKNKVLPPNIACFGVILSNGKIFSPDYSRLRVINAIENNCSFLVIPQDLQSVVNQKEKNTATRIIFVENLKELLNLPFLKDTVK